ncbi:hypothetical protein ACROYT_G011056 [Oculina patagonica]
MITTWPTHEKRVSRDALRPQEVQYLMVRVQEMHPPNLQTGRKRKVVNAYQEDQEDNLGRKREEVLDRLCERRRCACGSKLMQRRTGSLWGMKCKRVKAASVRQQGPSGGPGKWKINKEGRL